MGNRRFNDSLDKMGIWSRANNHGYDKGYIRIFGMTKMEKKLYATKTDLIIAKNDKERKK